MTRLVLLSVTIDQHFTFSETATCFTCILLLKIALFKSIPLKCKVVSCNMSHFFRSVLVSLGLIDYSAVTWAVNTRLSRENNIETDRSNISRLLNTRSANSIHLLTLSSQPLSPLSRSQLARHLITFSIVSLAIYRSLNFYSS